MLGLLTLRAGASFWHCSQGALLEFQLQKAPPTPVTQESRVICSPTHL